MEVGQRLVAVDTVVKAEAEEVDLAAHARVDRHLAVEVEEVERQAAVDIGVDGLRRLRQE